MMQHNATEYRYSSFLLRVHATFDEHAGTH